MVIVVLVTNVKRFYKYYIYIVTNFILFMNPSTSIVICLHKYKSQLRTVTLAGYRHSQMAHKPRQVFICSNVAQREQLSQLA